MINTKEDCYKDIIESPIDRLIGILRGIADREYQERLNLLIINVNYTLHTNPHNNFEGTALEYVKKYGLDTELRNKIDKYYQL